MSNAMIFGMLLILFLTDSPVMAITVRLVGSGGGPDLSVFEPEVDGLMVSVNGVVFPGNSGTSIVRIHWDWGDGNGEDHWFPASHTYASDGNYTITVTAFQSDGLTATETKQLSLGPPISFEAFSFVDVTLSVRDYSGLPLANAEVKAFSEDWGIKYPDWFGYTDFHGNYAIEIPTGNWSFFAGGGSSYQQSHPGQGYFGVLDDIQVVQNCTLTVQPNDTIGLEVYDINGAPLDAEARIMEHDHVPIIIAPTCGSTSGGRLTIHVTGGLRYDVLVSAFPMQTGYILLQDSITSGSTVAVRPTLQDVSCVLFEAFDKYFNPTSGLWVNLNCNNFSVGENGGLQPVGFQVDRTRQIYVSPGLAWISYSFDSSGWHYSFTGNDYVLNSSSQLDLKFGGALSLSVHVLQQNTQIWIDVRDSFNNTMSSFNDPYGNSSVPIRLTKNGDIFYEGDIAKNVGWWNEFLAGKLDQTYSPTDSINYEIPLDLGVFGAYDLQGQLLSDATLLKYETIISDHFIMQAPQGFTGKFNQMIRLFEQAYEAEAQALQVNLTEKTTITFYINYISAGFASTYTIGMGIGFSLDSSLNTIPSTFAGVAFHELGHVFQLSPPLNNCYIESYFGEPFATLMGNEAIAKIFGHKLGLLDQGSHRDFFRYLQAKTDINVGENVQFILFYLRACWGMDIHAQFVNLWSNQTASSPKQKLTKQGFNTDETIVVLYSSLAQRNLAQVFQAAGFNVSEERVAQGLKMLAPLPVANFEANQDVSWVRESIFFNASASYSSNGNLTSYKWDFGDGSTATLGVPTVSHTYTKEGVYTVVLNVTDSYGLSNTGSRNVTVTFKTDLNKDRAVNILDISEVAKSFGSVPGDPNWNEIADLDNNGIINIIDITMVARDYGKAV